MMEIALQLTALQNGCMGAALGPLSIRCILGCHPVVSLTEKRLFSLFGQPSYFASIFDGTKWHYKMRPFLSVSRSGLLLPP
jgi:hypothetical protein